jgi:hypothetical protein
VEGYSKTHRFIQRYCHLQDRRWLHCHVLDGCLEQTPTSEQVPKIVLICQKQDDISCTISHKQYFGVAISFTIVCSGILGVS